jgi:hypothetical protein
MVSALQGVLVYSAIALFGIGFWLVVIGLGMWVWRGLAGFIEVAW